MIFMKHRNLEKAVVLSLILSTGVYGSAWAETTTTGSLWDGENGVNKTVESGDLFIDASLNPGENGELAGAGPSGKIDVEKGDLTIDTDYNGVDVGYKKDAQMNIYADNITITAGKNGIFTATENSGDGTVTIGSEDRKIESLTITSGGQGIDNKSGNVYIYGADGSVFSIHSNTTSGDNINQAAINNERDGEIIINGGTINLSSDKFEGQHPTFPDYTAIFTGDGITNDDGTTILNFNNVRINVTGSGIRNTGSGTVS